MVPATIKSTSQTKSYTCYKYQQNDIPCTHAFALILCLNYLFPLVFLPQFRSVQSNLAKYLLFEFSLYCFRSACTTTRASYQFRERTCTQCPSHLHTSGTPKKERYRRGKVRQHATRAQEHLCSTCGQPGHNSHTCRTPCD